MCGQYCIESDNRHDELYEIIAEARRKAEKEGAELKTGEIFPSDVVPVIAPGKDRAPGVFPMRWGFDRPDGGLVINARSETAASRPMFRESIRLRRCLIPATNYFEWERRGAEKTKYAIQVSDSDRIYLGGLYILTKGERLARFVILTRPPAANIAFIHDRMPVIVPHDKISEWLDSRISFDELMKGTPQDVAYQAADNGQE